MTAWPVVALLAAAVALALAAVAGGAMPASIDVSANWAGYVAIGPGSTSATASSAMTYTDVTGQWAQPKVSCPAGARSSVSIWVGLGGYSLSSTELEQVGTEADCDASGKATYSVWYELVPAGPVTVDALTIRPGDAVAASIVVDATGLLVQVIDRTRQRRFTRHLTVASPDLTSAEWITEAPSECSADGSCSQTALAAFAPFQFSRSFAKGNGVPGTISSPSWLVTGLRLVPRSYRAFGGPDGQASLAGGAGAEPSALTAGGSGFAVTWQATPQGMSAG